MNPEITLDDYEKIGTMETALSEHADEAFFELSAEAQKIAEKIFKCLTETDRENREIRRAMTIEKLCAVADADFAEVASVIEVFRREGRTFLMPPPEVPLNKNSLIDISHESLIRKWERLKKWVEEEGQSARTYRRLAEDALLHKQERMGFWSDPELKDALEWRENFKPNETWAQLYKETGERQFKASFAESMEYLDESAINRDEEIAEDVRQQNALRKYARNLRWTVIGLVFFSFLIIGAAGFAFYQMNEAVQVKNALFEEKRMTEELNSNLETNALRLEAEKNEKEKAFNDLKDSQEKLSESLELQKEATEKAEREKEHAKLSEAEKKKALEKQEELAAAAKVAEIEAIRLKDRALESLKRANASRQREEFNRKALTLLEQGEYAEAELPFLSLLESFENGSELMDEKTRTDGKWWASHNLGIVYAKLGKYEEAQKFYIKAHGAIVASKDKSAERVKEINRSLVTTFRRLGQLNHDEAENATRDELAKMYNRRAIGYYNQLLRIQEKPSDAEQAGYLADVYVELADTLYDFQSYEPAKKFYKKAEELYGNKNDYDKQVAVLRKWADTAIRKTSRIDEESNEDAKSDENAKLNEDAKSNEDAEADENAALEEYPVRLVERAIEIQENKDKMKLSPLSLEIADSYDQLAKVAVFSAEGDYYEPPPYDKLAQLIRKMNYAADKKSYISEEEFRELANTYVKVEKCRRAEETYFKAIEWSKQPENKYLRTDFGYLEFYLDLAELYKNVLRDDRNAQNYFDLFVAESEKGKPGSVTPYITEGLFEKAGDFSFAVRNYQQASKFYQYALQKLNEAIGSDEEIIRATKEDGQPEPEENVKSLIKLSLNKAELLAKIARVYEQQGEQESAKKLYSEAQALISSKFGETGIEKAKIFINEADFYERLGNNEEATKKYNEAESILNVLTKSNNQPALALQIHVQKKLGDISRKSAAADAQLNAAQFYETAILKLDYYGQVQGGEEYENLQSATPVECRPKVVSRYTRDGKLTKEFWTDKAEILEELAKLLEGKNGEAIKAKLKIEDIPGELGTAKLLSEDFKDCPCLDDDCK